MSAGLHDMAQMTVSGTPGTGTITLLAAVPGFQTFAAAGVVDQEIVSYSASDQGGTIWEIGRGLYTASGTTLTRGPIFGSSGAGVAVSLSANAVVWIATLAEDEMPLEAVAHAVLGGI